MNNHCEIELRTHRTPVSDSLAFVLHSLGWLEQIGAWTATYPALGDFIRALAQVTAGLNKIITGIDAALDSKEPNCQRKYVLEELPWAQSALRMTRSHLCQATARTRRHRAPGSCMKDLQEPCPSVNIIRGCAAVC